MKKKFFLLPSLLIPVTILAQFDRIKSTETVQPVIMNKQPAVIKNTMINTVAYDISKVKICVDIAPPTSVNLPPRRNSAGTPVPKINSDGSLLQVGVTQQPLAGATEKMWNPGDVISVYLSPNNGSDMIKSRVQFYAKKWEDYGNIKFEFINDFKAAKIKVGFFNTGQSWSWMGRDVLFNPFNAYTMNFGWFDANTDDLEIGRVVTHEFGHALGFHHEHQSPASPLQWNLDKTYKYFKDLNNWTPGEVDVNIINKFNQNNTNYSGYDRYSIMHYPIPEELLLNGATGAPVNYWISQIDGQFTRLWYPFPPKGRKTYGNLRTNDDCDDVFFTVEYDVVAADKVEFALLLGETNSKKVTWWKQIGIPMTNNTETVLWVQNHSLILEENQSSASLQIPVNQINNNKGISFWKAKMLGVHTLLDYKWNVLPAIQGGCRITLSWNKDSCL